MLKKKAIRVFSSSEDEVVSGYFARPKKAAGKFRPIVSCWSWSKPRTPRRALATPRFSWGLDAITVFIPQEKAVKIEERARLMLKAGCASANGLCALLDTLERARMVNT